MRLIILSDIHANVTAFEAVLSDMKSIGHCDAIAILGDIVNYGPRPNEVINTVKGISLPIIINLWGNHEYSIFGGNLDRFATDRGRAVLKYTNSILTKDSRDYLDSKMNHRGSEAIVIDNQPFLFVHGNIDDSYWGKLGIDSMNDERYADYDFVVSGHSHIPHYVEQFFSSDNKNYRDKKRTVFINPGSVGQPRNHTPHAQYGILDTESGNYEHRSVWYDVKKEQVLFSDEIDQFYKERLILGV